ncbi:Ran GTPase binding protein Sbp1 [Mycoemilia scoparia]|uniref:Ran GTPase binding protein Sbp1 n=1 Tax=Mycoemilia scoparia TaxID=417184 RepID=A0A9W8DUA6_9FUNG|nr:Ran GTPase binding protein Sbp1 [Mycoemilia scoparia]
MSEVENKATSPKVEEQDEVPPSTDVHVEPIMKLENVKPKNREEDENVLFKMRAKLYRFDKEGNEWKERGTGDVKIMEHKETKKIRVVMHREKIHKLCANHYITEEMKLSPNVGSDRSWVWTTAADFADEEPEHQTLAIRFANSENANLFKEAFDKAREAVKSRADENNSKDHSEKEKPEEKEEEKITDAESKPKEDAKEEAKEEKKDGEEEGK